MKERLNKLFLIFYIWIVGLVGGFLFWLLRIFGRIKIDGYELKKLIPSKENLIVIYNHPSLWEPAILPFLFFPWYLLYLQMIPFSTPDKENYYDRWWFTLFRPVSIPIKREGKGRIESLKRLILWIRIREGKILILAPEGGRTFKGEEFKFIENGKVVIKKDWEVVKNKNRIRRFQRGVHHLIQKTQTSVLPIWIEGGDKVIPNKSSFPRFPHFPFPKFWKKVRIKIGKPLKAKEIPSVEELENVLLKCFS